MIYIPARMISYLSELVSVSRHYKLETLAISLTREQYEENLPIIDFYNVFFTLS